MSKMMVTVALSFLLALGIGLFCGGMSHETSQDFILQVEQVAVQVRKGNWENASALARAAEKAWEKRSPLLAMWVLHEDVDQVSLGLVQLRVSVEKREEYHALLYAAELDEALSLLYHRDAFALKNIL